KDQVGDFWLAPFLVLPPQAFGVHPLLCVEVEGDRVAGRVRAAQSATPAVSSHDGRGMVDRALIGPHHLGDLGLAVLVVLFRRTLRMRPTLGNRLSDHVAATVEDAAEPTCPDAFRYFVGNDDYLR